VRALAAWLQATHASHTIQTVSWVIPLLQSIHILMIGVVFVSSLMICLRVLGGVRTDEPFAAVSFWIKMALVAGGVAGTAAYGRSLARLALPGAGFSVPARAGAVLIIFLWLAVIFLGRAIAYDREVWGSLSLHA